MLDTKPRRGPGRPPPAEWDYQTKHESEPTDAEDADTAPA